MSTAEIYYSHTVRLGRPGGSGGPRWPRLSESWVVREDSDCCYLHPDVIPVSPPVTGLSPVSSRVKTSRKTQVLPGCSRCPPGVLPTSSRCSRMSSVLSGMGPVYSRRTPVVDASRSHLGSTGDAGVHFLDMGCIFTYLIQYISNQIYVLKTYYNSHITNTWLYKTKYHSDKSVYIYMY